MSEIYNKWALITPVEKWVMQRVKVFGQTIVVKAPCLLAACELVKEDFGLKSLQEEYLEPESHKLPKSMREIPDLFPGY